MSTISPNLALQLLVEGQSSPEVTVNTALQTLDALFVGVESMTTNAEPGSPTNGQAYIIGPTPTGTEWSGNAGKLAVYSNGWIIIAPKVGFRAYVKDLPGWVVYIGSAWVGAQGTATLVGGTVTVNTTQVAAGSKIILSRQATGGTLGHLSVGTIVAATSFVINSSSGTDTSVIFWQIVPA